MQALEEEIREKSTILLNLYQYENQKTKWTFAQKHLSFAVIFLKHNLPIYYILWMINKTYTQRFPYTRNSHYILSNAHLLDNSNTQKQGGIFDINFIFDRTPLTFTPHN